MNLASMGHINDMILIEPAKIKFGQTPESQFPPMRFLGGLQEGNWDQQLIPIESHLLYKSYVQHFIQGEPWINTPFYKFALESIENGQPFRLAYDTPEALEQRFAKCDLLYEAIQSDGYKSKRQLYKEGIINNVLELLDEVTVNIARDGSIILNDGWHRFATVRILQIPTIPARLCAKHTQSK
jgi:hypothetical protein